MNEGIRQVGTGRRVDGKVALVTGAARGQGRSHAIVLAREGAQVIAVDICQQIPSVRYPMSVPADLEETKRLVEQQGQRCLAIEADVRSAHQMEKAIADGIDEFGKIDILVINHGIAHMASWADTTEELWRDAIDTMLSGVWYSVRPAIPHMIENGGGSIIMISSTAGLKPVATATAYIAAKHGVLGLMRSLSAQLGEHWIRVNAVLPGNVLSPMVDNDYVLGHFAGGRPSAEIADAEFPAQTMNILPIPWVQPQDISNAVLFLASEEARYVTGIAMPVDAGMLNQPPGIPLIATEKIADLEQQHAQVGAG